mmetsp:Transcript_42589/g.79833  ORF Transcript_42589/g.79833 Transcript_42589/m.79833 type:complete len:220 (-) Transcript_42589:398-1057(-)
MAAGNCRTFFISPITSKYTKCDPQAKTMDARAWNESTTPAPVAQCVVVTWLLDSSVDPPCPHSISRMQMSSTSSTAAPEAALRNDTWCSVRICTKGSKSAPMTSPQVGWHSCTLGNSVARDCVLTRRYSASSMKSWVRLTARQQAWPAFPISSAPRCVYETPPGIATRKRQRMRPVYMFTANNNTSAPSPGTQPNFAMLLGRAMIPRPTTAATIRKDAW